MNHSNPVQRPQGLPATAAGIAGMSGCMRTVMVLALIGIVFAGLYFVALNRRYKHALTYANEMGPLMNKIGQSLVGQRESKAIEVLGNFSEKHIDSKDGMTRYRWEIMERPLDRFLVPYPAAADRDFG